MKQRTNCLGRCILLAVLLISVRESTCGAPGDKRWELQFDGFLYGAPALSTNGDLLVSSCDGRLYAVSPSGVARWSFQTSRSVNGVPTVADDGTIYCGSDRVYALKPDGSTRWVFPDTPSAFSDPLLGPGGVVYAVDGNKRLYAINPDGSRRWMLQGSFPAPPVMSEDGTLWLPEMYGYVSAVNPDGVLRSRINVGPISEPVTPLIGGNILLPETGSTALEGSLQALTASGLAAWRFVGGSFAGGSPVVGADGAIYCGFYAGRVVALEKDGQLRWEYKTSGSYSFLPSPALAADGTLYVSHEKRLYALDPSGHLLWNFDAAATLQAPMIGPDGTVYVGTFATPGILYAVEGTGAPLAPSSWPMSRRDARHRAALVGPVAIPAMPTNFTATVDVHTDQVALQWDSVIGATHYQVLRSGSPDVAKAVVITNSLTGTKAFADRGGIPGTDYYYFVRASNSAGYGPTAGPVQGRRRVARVGEAAWIFPTQAAINGSPAIGLDGTVFICSSDGYLYAADAAGNEKWRFRYGGPTSTSPSVGADGTVYFGGAISQWSSAETNAIFAVSSTGQLRWRYVSGPGILSGVSIGTNGTLYATAIEHTYLGTGGIYAMTPEGSNIWSFTSRSFYSTAVIGADGTIYAGAIDGIMVALRPDGSLLWECNTGDGCSKAPVIDGNGVLFTAGASFHAINPDGQRLWTKAMQYRSDAGPNCVDAAGSVFAQGDYTFYRMSPDGANLYKFPLPSSKDRTLSHVIKDANETIYVSVDNAYYGGKVYALSSAGATQWEFANPQVTFGGATLGFDNKLYVPASDGRVYAILTPAGPVTSAWPQPLHDPQHTARATQIPSAPSAPPISATFRTRVTDVRVTWNAALGASAYQVFRAMSTNLADSVMLAEVSGQILFDDNTAVPEAAYTYWVRAKNIGGTGPFSAAAPGMRRQAVPGERLYEWNLYGNIDTSPAIAADGTIYVSVNYPVYNAPDAGRKVVALRPDGTTRWQYLTGEANLTSPTIATDGTVYVGIRGALNMFPYLSPLLALNPDGTKRWEFLADDAIETTPVLAADGTVYVGSGLGTLYAVSPAGHLLWTNHLGAGLIALAVARDGTIYARSPQGYVYAVSAAGGTLWQTGAGGYQAGGSLAITAEGEICLATGGGLNLLNPDGTLSRQISNIGLWSTPVIGTNGCFIIGDTTGKLYFINAAGTNIWSTNSGSGYYSAAAVSSSGVVVAGNFAGKLTAVSHDAAKLWEYSAESNICSAPAIAPDGTIYVGTAGGKLVSIFGSGALAGTAWPMFQRDARHTGRDCAPATFPASPTNVIVSDGTFNDRVRVSWKTVRGAAFYEVWRHIENDMSGAVMISPLVTAQTFFDDKSVLPGTNYFYWVRAGNGLGLGTFSQSDRGYRRVAVPGELLEDSRPINATGTSPALGFDGSIYAGGSGRLYALNPDLTQSWEFAQGTVSTPAIGPDGIIHIWSSNRRFYGLNPAGNQSWSLPVTYNSYSPAAITTDGAVIIVSGDKKVFCFDPATGALRWQYAVATNVTAAPAVGADGSVFFGTQDGQLHALRSDGSLQWRYRVGASIQSSPAVGTDGVVYFGADDRGIYAVGPDGRRRWAAQAGDVVRASPVITPEGNIVVGSHDRKLYAFRPDGTKCWDFRAESAIRSSACVGADGLIYFGTYNGWVYALNKDGAVTWAFNSATNAFSGPVLDSPLLIEDRLLVPINSVAIQAFSVSAGPANLNWPQYRRDAQRTACAKTWLALGSSPGSGSVAGEDLSFAANFSCPGRSISRLELLSGYQVVAASIGTNVITWCGVPAGTHSLCLRAIDDAGNLHSSAPWNLKVGSAPTIAISPAGSGGWMFHFETTIGRRYQIERSVNLRDWEAASGPLTATNSNQAWTEASPVSGAAYYRVTILP